MNVFITGATGFLGTNLIKRLIESNHNVYLLVRNPKKLTNLLSSIEEEKKELIHIINGELTKENLGMEELVISQLKGKIDIIYHTAAFLSFDESKSNELKQINITGTKNVLNVAEKIQIEKFIHVSTAYTLGTRKEGIEELYSLTTTFNNTYEESKCLAEQLVMSYQDKFDVSIMRPSIIIGDSETGEANTTFGLYGFLRTIELLKKRDRKRPNSKQKYRLLIEDEEVSNLVPVNFVVDVLFLGLNYAKKNTIYNITNSNSPKNETIIKIIKDVFEFNSIELIPYKDKDILTETELNINEPLKVFKEYLNRSIEFSNENTRELLLQGNKSDLNMDTEMIYRIIRGFKNRRTYEKELVLQMN